MACRPGHERRRQVARQPRQGALSRRLDPRRRERPGDGLHRQGGARPGHQDGAYPGRRRRVGGVPAQVAIVTADTARTADEGYTAGSHSMQDSGTAIRNAAAQVRVLLAAMAANGSACRSKAAPRRRPVHDRAGQRHRLRRAGERRRAARGARRRASRPAARTPSWASRCNASTFRPRSAAASLMCRI